MVIYVLVQLMHALVHQIAALEITDKKNMACSLQMAYSQCMAGWLHVSWKAQSNETGLWSGRALPWEKRHETLGQITLGQQLELGFIYGDIPCSN